MVKVMKYSHLLTLIGAFQLQLHWLEAGVDTQQVQFTLLTQFKCENIPVCAVSQSNESFSVVSKAQCVLYCQHQRLQPWNCLGVNYQEQKNTCDVFYKEVTQFSRTVKGCQYIQKESVDNLNCTQLFPKLCKSSPCLNNGTCVDILDAYNCSCVSGLTGGIAGFEGTRCEIIVSNVISFPASYNYFRVSGVQLSNKSAVLVYGKISNDLNVALTAAPDDYTVNTMYEIVIGGAGNSEAVLRKVGLGPLYARVPTASYLSAATYRAFWITWKSGMITVGQDTTVGSKAFMTYNDPTPSAVNYIAVGGYNAAGSAYVKVLP